MCSIASKIILGSSFTLFSTLGLSQGVSSERRDLSLASRFEPLSVGANVAMADVDDVRDNIFSFGMFGDYALEPNFSVGASLDFWNDSFDASRLRRGEIADTTLGINGRFSFLEFKTGLKPYLLAGLAAHRFTVNTVKRDADAVPIVDKFGEFDRRNNDISAELGADFAAGIRYRVQGTTDIAGEVRYRRILDRAVALDQRNYSLSLSYAM